MTGVFVLCAPPDQTFVNFSAEAAKICLADTIPRANSCSELLVGSEAVPGHVYSGGVGPNVNCCDFQCVPGPGK